LVGEKDEATPVGTAKAIQRQVEGSELVVIPDAFHLTNVETVVLFNQNLLGLLR
jgi:3-oxoadipate enol-lactonase